MSYSITNNPIDKFKVIHDQICAKSIMWILIKYNFISIVISFILAFFLFTFCLFHIMCLQPIHFLYIHNCLLPCNKINLIEKEKKYCHKSCGVTQWVISKPPLIPYIFSWKCSLQSIIGLIQGLYFLLHSRCRVLPGAPLVYPLDAFVEEILQFGVRRTRLFMGFTDHE